MHTWSPDWKRVDIIIILNVNIIIVIIIIIIILIINISIVITKNSRAHWAPPRREGPAPSQR